MIKGIGTDIIEIERIERAFGRSKGMKDRIFVKEEKDFLEASNWKAESVAGYFAAKEAVLKAFGTGLRGTTFKDIVILKDELGAPYVELRGSLLERSKSLNIDRVHISISHCRSYATAVAICECIGGN